MSYVQAAMLRHATANIRPFAFKSTTLPTYDEVIKT